MRVTVAELVPLSTEVAAAAPEEAPEVGRAVWMLERVTPAAAQRFATAGAISKRWCQVKVLKEGWWETY